VALAVNAAIGKVLSSLAPSLGVYSVDPSTISRKVQELVGKVTAPPEPLQVAK